MTTYALWAEAAACVAIIISAWICVRRIQKRTRECVEAIRRATTLDEIEQASAGFSFFGRRRR